MTNTVGFQLSSYVGFYDIPAENENGSVSIEGIN